ncbi:AfsA-related hotdog domain-containing protein [Streptomyces sp. NPDC020898]|uniref:AfsA-related hotdog domain-containing protein n=1 Tax=Streptomyces sp. NPDC020898 TaxID=3365101 RepID=UPI0037B3A35C
MPTPTRGTALPESAAQLNFSHTVAREMIHRRHLTEVFLTDVLQVDAQSFVAAAVLPPVHPYYTGRTHAAGSPDPMLLLECCRQAETYAAHAFFGVETGAGFVLRNWSLEVSPQAFAPVPSGSNQLFMTAVAERRGPAATRAHGMVYEFRLWLADTQVGQVRMDVGYLAKDAYASVRSRRRGHPPAMSDEQPTAGAGQPVDPARVGRTRTMDALLSDVGVARGALTATLRLATDNPSYFDHPQDHVPGMVLTEAACQMAVLALEEWGGIAPRLGGIVAVESSFLAFAELDEPVVLTAARPSGGGGRDVASDGRERDRAVEVTFYQRGAEITRTKVVMATSFRARPTSPGCLG